MRCRLGPFGRCWGSGLTIVGFHDPASLEVEIGCGRGRFLVQRAREHPQHLFVGIDINEVSCRRTRERYQTAELTNVRVYHSEAERFIDNYLEDSSVEAFHIYFPTPYIGPLQLHNVLGARLRHRLVDSSFLGKLVTKSKRGASLRMATDHRDYFEQIATALEELRLETVPWVTPVLNKRFDELVGSGCEREQREKGRRIYYLQCLLR